MSLVEDLPGHRCVLPNAKPCGDGVITHVTIRCISCVLCPVCEWLVLVLDSVGLCFHICGAIIVPMKPSVLFQRRKNVRRQTAAPPKNTGRCPEINVVHTPLALAHFSLLPAFRSLQSHLRLVKDEV